MIMNIKKICSIWVERTSHCSECHKAHYILNYGSLSKENRKKLKPMKCHLPIHPSNKHGKGYMGSYEEENHTVDVYDYPINSRTYVIELRKSQKKSENLANNLIEEETEQQFIYQDMDSEEEEF